MDTEHGHVEYGGNEDKTDGACHEVFDEQLRRDAKVAEEIPKLLEGTETDGSDGEETDPFAADYSTKGETCHGEPDPPVLGERFMVVLVAECGPGKGGEGGEEDERRVEEDVTGLGDQAIFEGDEEGCKEGGCDTTIEGAKGQVGERNGSNAHAGGKKAHCYVRYMLVRSVQNDVSRMSVMEREGSRHNILSNILEVKIAIVAKDPASEGDEQLGERRVHVDKVGRLDVS